MFLENSSDLEIDDEDLIISSPSSVGEQKSHNGSRVCIQHQPTGIIAESSGI